MEKHLGISKHKDGYTFLTLEQIIVKILCLPVSYCLEAHSVLIYLKANISRKKKKNYSLHRTGILPAC